jgi:iron complex transport system ATP-binding protein
MALLSTDALHVSIGDTTVCTTLDLAVSAGERWCILGRNGTGKTTLLHTLAGLRDADAGDIRLHDQSLQSLPRRTVAQHIGLLFQDHSDAFPASVMETVLSGRHPWIGPLQWESEQDIALARAALHAVNLDELEQRIVTTLSGGERRRLGLATLLSQDPQLMLLDEPTNHLDIHHQIGMLDLLQEKSVTDRTALVFVMHDINLALRYCTHFLLLFGDGETALGNAAEVLTRDRLERLYQHPLQKLQGTHGNVWLPQ